eukprot:5246855-Alexandrium_andersonii.AAC.1
MLHARDFEVTTTSRNPCSAVCEHKGPAGPLGAHANTHAAHYTNDTTAKGPNRKQGQPTATAPPAS